jgi:hypothetical protein
MEHALLSPAVWFNCLLLLVPVAIVLLARRPALWPHLFSFALGIVVAIIDTGTKEMQFPALLLLLFGLFLGFEHPVRAWRWAALLGAWVPVFACSSSLLRNGTLSPLGESLGSLLALAPSFVGTYAGVATRRFLSRNGEG